MSQPVQRPWWDALPGPVTRLALGIWSRLPGAVRAPFIPIGRWISPVSTTSAGFESPGPDTVGGVSTLRAEGFEPIEEYTGAVDVAELWPTEHRRSVAETREWRLEHAECGGRLWLVRTPWPSLGVQDALNVVWSWVERDRAPMNAALWRERVAETLSWDEPTATAWVEQQSRT